MKAVIAAAGRGSRLAQIGAELPKVLQPVGRLTCLDHILLGLKAAGITELVLVVGFHGDKVIRHMERLQEQGIWPGSAAFAWQDLSRYGTAAALQAASKLIGEEPFLFTFGDILVAPENYAGIVAVYKRRLLSVLAVNAMADASAGAAVFFDSAGLVTDIVEKPDPKRFASGWNQAGIFVWTADIWKFLDAVEPSPRGEYELTQAVAAKVRAAADKSGHIQPIAAYPVRGYWKDVGNPEDLLEIQTILAEAGEACRSQERQLRTEDGH